MSHRYDAGIRLLTATLPILRSDPGFRQVIAALRADDWLDWHILMATVNIAHNWRLQRKLSPEVLADPARRKAVLTAGLEAEPPGALPVPTSEFTLEAMQQARVMALPAVLINWELELRQQTPDLSAVERLLDARYGYWTVDVEHDDPFFNPPAVEAA